MRNIYMLFQKAPLWSHWFLAERVVTLSITTAAHGFSSDHVQVCISYFKAFTNSCIFFHGRSQNTTLYRHMTFSPPVGCISEHANTKMAIGKRINITDFNIRLSRKNSICRNHWWCMFSSVGFSSCWLWSPQSLYILENHSSNRVTAALLSCFRELSQKNKHQISRGRKDVHQKTCDPHLVSIYVHTSDLSLLLLEDLWDYSRKCWKPYTESGKPGQNPI